MNLIAGDRYNKSTGPDSVTYPQRYLLAVPFPLRETSARAPVGRASRVTANKVTCAPPICILQVSQVPSAM